jgi:hypothetical protein
MLWRPGASLLRLGFELGIVVWAIAPAEEVTVSRLGRSDRALSVVSLAASCLLGLAMVVVLAGQPATQAQAGSAASLPTPIEINGNPLRVVLAADSSIQVYHSARPGMGQVFGWTHDSADSGIWLWVGDKIYGPDSCFDGRLSAMLKVLPWSVFSHSGPGGSGTEADPWVVTTVLDAGTSGVRVTQHAYYINGQNHFRLRWELENSTDSSQTVNLFHAVDSYFASDTYVRGYYNPIHGAVGGYDSANPWYMLFVPIDGQASGFKSDWADEVWAAIGFCGDSYSCPVAEPCEAGPGFVDPFDANLTGADNGFGLQWERTLAAGGSSTVSDWWTFGTSPNIPSTQPPTPVPTRTPTITPAVSPTPTPTRTATPLVTPRRSIYLPLVKRRSR